MLATTTWRFPTGDAIAGWWRQLVSLRPAAMWVARFYCHRVEACVSIPSSGTLERVDALLLQAVGLEAAADEPMADRLARRLQMPAPIVQQLMRPLMKFDLITEDWRITDLGRAALASGSHPITTSQRRQFTFVERQDAEGRRAAPPHYLPLPTPGAQPWKPAEGEAFPLASLDAAIARPEEWKRAFQFPRDVVGVAVAEPQDDWRRVTIVKAEQHPILIVEAGTADPLPLKFYALKSENAALPSTTPFLSLGADKRLDLPEWFPQLDASVPAPDWSVVGNGPVRPVRLG